MEVLVEEHSQAPGSGPKAPEEAGVPTLKISSELMLSLELISGPLVLDFDPDGREVSAGADDEYLMVRIDGAQSNGFVLVPAANWNEAIIDGSYARSLRRLLTERKVLLTKEERQLPPSATLAQIMQILGQGTSPHAVAVAVRAVVEQQVSLM